MPSNQNLKKQIKELERKCKKERIRRKEAERKCKEAEKECEEERRRRTLMIKAGYNLIHEIFDGYKKFKKRRNKKKALYKIIKPYTITETNSSRNNLIAWGFTNIRFTSERSSIDQGTKLVSPLNIQKKKLKHIEPTYNGEIAKIVKTHPYFQREISKRDKMISERDKIIATLREKNLKLEGERLRIKREVSGLCYTASPEYSQRGRMNELRQDLASLKRIVCVQ